MYNYNFNASATGSAGAGFIAAIIVFYLAIFLFFVICYWRIFTKAGEAGWKSIIPIYNSIILLKIIKKPWWWIFLFLIPIVNIVIAVIVALELAKVFGKSPVFGVVGLFLFSIVGYPMLAFGSATYTGGDSAAPVAPTTTPPLPPTDAPTIAPTPAPQV